MDVDKLITQNKNKRIINNNAKKDKVTHGRKSLMGCLSHETCWSLCHTLRSMVHVIRALLLDHGFKFVLPGYLNNDYLEKRFSCVRSMSGGNSSTNVARIFCSERILF